MNSVRIFVASLLIEGRKEDAIRTYPGIAADIDLLLRLDPTPQKKYLMWMARQVSENEYDIFDVGNIVTTFHAFANKLPANLRDINKFDYIDDVRYAVEDAIQQKSKGKEIEINRSGGKIVGSNDKYKLVKVETREVACNLGRGTRWCLAAYDPRYWEKYTKPQVDTIMEKKIGTITIVYYLIPVSAGSGDKFAITLNAAIVLNGPSEGKISTFTYIWNKKDEKFKYTPGMDIPGIELFTNYMTTSQFNEDIAQAVSTIKTTSETSSLNMIL